MSEVSKNGLIHDSLSRSNKKIRSERGDALAEQLETTFRRDIEDIRYKIKDLERNRRGMYDFSPDNAHSLVMLRDVNAKAILEKEKEATDNIRNMKIELELSEERFLELFGKEIPVQ